MSNEQDKALEMFCTAVEMKEKKRTLYEDAMKTCPDQVGIETFRMLHKAEVEHLARIQEVYDEMKKGKTWVDACRYHESHAEDKKEALRRIAEQRGKLPNACVDDIVAIETGLQLENASINYFENRLPLATEAVEREFIEGMIAEEREHYILLADLKFYYADPQAWFMEKGKARLDGGGAGS